jgi:hypothetical protein
MARRFVQACVIECRAAGGVPASGGPTEPVNCIEACQSRTRKFMGAGKSLPPEIVRVWAAPKVATEAVFAQLSRASKLLNDAGRQVWDQLSAFQRMPAEAMRLVASEFSQITASAWEAIEPELAQLRDEQRKKERQQAAEFAAGVRSGVEWANADLAESGLDPPGWDFEKWEHLARMVGKDPGPLSLREIHQWAVAWADGQRTSARLQAAERAGMGGADPTLTPGWRDAAMLPKSVMPALVGARWADVWIKFQDCQNVRVTVRGQSQYFDYKQLGMVDRRDQSPKEQWVLLYRLSEHDGRLDWNHRAASRKLQKQKEKLGRSLKRAFGIDEEPIASVGSGWQTRFRLTQA